MLSLTVSCNVQIPNTEICSVSGILAGGAYCVNTLNNKTRVMTLTEFINFLQADKATEKSAALCMANNDFRDLQIALEQACRKIGAKCSKETQEQIQQVKDRIQKLSAPKPVPVPVPVPIYDNEVRPTRLHPRVNQ